MRTTASDVQAAGGAPAHWRRTATSPPLGASHETDGQQAAGHVEQRRTLAPIALLPPLRLDGRTTAAPVTWRAAAFAWEQPRECDRVRRQKQPLLGNAVDPIVGVSTTGRERDPGCREGAVSRPTHAGGSLPLVGHCGSGEGPAEAGALYRNCEQWCASFLVPAAWGDELTQAPWTRGAGSR